MVGIVVVSHSDTLAEGVVKLAREMAGPELALEAAGGIEEPGVLGTDAERVRAAIERAMSPDGVLVMMDLGSALMSAELAVELLDGASGPVRLSDAPLVEGAVAAAVAASGGAGLDEVAAEARGALAMKTAQIGVQPAPEVKEEPDLPADATAELHVLNEIGLHARPAARFVGITRGFDAQVRVTKLGSNRAPVGAKSLTALVSLGARSGDVLLVSARGPQAHDAVEALRALADTGFGDGVVTPSPSEPATTPGTSIPAAPQAGSVLTGVAANAGVAIGPAYLLVGGAEAPPAEAAARSPDEELALLEHGIDVARSSIERDRELIRARAGGAEAEIFDAHLALLDDEALLEPARNAVARGVSAGRAWHDAAAQVAEIYRGLSDPLLAERATDVLDVGRRVVAALEDRPASGGGFPAGVVVADELTPADTARFDPHQVVAVATARGSTTAHAAILARALGLPAVVGLGEAVLAVAAGTVLLVDGESGKVQVDPSAAVIAHATERLARRRERAAAARERAHEPGRTRDGQRVEVFANIASERDAARAVELGAEGVGLLRTEFMFLDGTELPGEDEQAERLREIAVALGGRDLVVRTLDAGADKPLPALPMPAEANPFLGVRGIRLGLAHPEVLATQFRAILRVAVEHRLKVMLPMVATLDEVLAARRVLDQARLDTGLNPPLEFGIMVEVPAAALMAPRLARHVDFFSLGTNDLTQYTMAAERGDARLAGLLAGPQPAVLRLVRAAVEAADAAGRWVGVCGELAGDPAAAVLLAGLGVRELSMSAGLIPEVKAALRAVDLDQARAAAVAALETDNSEAARATALRLL